MRDEEIGSFQWGDDYVSTVDAEERWIVEPLIPAEGIVNFYGKPKAGKSFAAMGVAQAVASGAEHWNEFKIHKHGPVAYFQIDTPRPEWKSRFARIKLAGYDISKIGIMDMKMAPYPFNIEDKTHQAWLRQQLEGIGPVLVVIDTLREIHEKDENGATDMRQVIGAIVKVTRPAAVLLVSHSRKDSAFNAMGAESDLMDEGRGSSYVPGRMDTVVKFTGRKGKGHMVYKGRSVSEGKIPVYQDPETGLVLIEGTHAKREQAVAVMLREHAHEWTKHRMATELTKTGLFGSVDTATRWITKLSGLAE